MQPDLPYVPSPQPRVFRYSLDWRFLLPASAFTQIYVAFDEAADFHETLERVGIPGSHQLSFSSFKQIERNDIHSFALPFGLPARWVSARREDQVDLYRSIRRMICPGGYFLLGFQNSWTFHANAQYHASRLPRVVRQLDQAGFKAIKIFGAMPDLHIPEYVFELSDQTMIFALRHRFQRKPVLLNMLEMLRWTVGLTYISNLLPGYFAVATA